MNSESVTKPIIIDKETVAKLHFTDRKNVNKDTRKELLARLKKATAIGNISHIKVKITFQDDESEKQIDTTIWATGDEYISIKGGLTIPICRIVEVILLGAITEDT